MPPETNSAPERERENGSVQLSNLARRWVHSHEEDEGDRMVFRPASFAFPRSRGRRELDLRPDGTMIEGGPSPTDRIQRALGSWQVAGTQLTLSGEGDARTYSIESAQADRLVLRHV
jgi:hypothetical protein